MLFLFPVFVKLTFSVQKYLQVCFCFIQHYVLHPYKDVTHACKFLHSVPYCLFSSPIDVHLVFLIYQLEKERATHSSILAQSTPWTEKPGRLQSMGLQESDMTYRLHQHPVYQYYKQHCSEHSFLVQILKKRVARFCIIKLIHYLSV